MPHDNVIPLRPTDGRQRPIDAGLRTRRDEPATYDVRVSLDGSEPEIWRRLELDSSLDLRSVHRILQATIGWLDAHLHEFTTAFSSVRLLADSEVEEGMEGVPERDVRLDEVLAAPGDLLDYLYDFGDSWDHTIVLEDVRPGEPARPVRVVGGDRACPLENAGGVGAWNAVVDWLDGGDADGLEEEWLRDLVEWIPIGFDAAHFDSDEASRAAEAAALATDELVLRLPPHPDLRSLAAALPEQGVRLLSSLCAPEAPPEADPDRALRPLLVLLRLVHDGVDLTPTGQMKQSAVRTLLDDLGWGGDWVFGKTLHEQHLPPVRWLRHGAHTLGLIRKRGGRLVLTPLGRELDGDASALWQHFVASLPVGDTTDERRAGVFWLLTLRAGRKSWSAYDRYAEALFDMAARQAGERPPRARQVHDWHLPTHWLLLSLQDDHASIAVSGDQAAAAHSALWDTGHGSTLVP